MDENQNGMINPLTPAPGNVEPVQPAPEVDLAQSAPIESVASQESITPIESTMPTESVAPTELVMPAENMVQQTFAQEPASINVSNAASASVPPKKKNTSLIVAIILGVIAIGCAVAAVLMFTVFKPTDGGSGNSGGSSTGGTDTPSTDTISTIDSCPGCVFTYSEEGIIYTSNNEHYSYESVEPGFYKTDWHEVVEESGHNVFLGLVLDDDNKPTNMYACGILDEKPYCLEGSLDDQYGGDQATRLEKYRSNISVLESVWPSNELNDIIIDYLNDDNYMLSRDAIYSIVYLEGYSTRGDVYVSDDDAVFCEVRNFGKGYCSDYSKKS